MLVLRPAAERGHSQLDWLDSQHTFSFDQYYDPKHMSFGPLRVINEDVIAGGGGFGTHPHRDMEIITYVIEGELQHKDSLGTGSIIRAGEIQKMSAGSGIRHSEFNASTDKPVHLLQIWIVPAEKNLKPAYEQEKFTLKEGEFTLLGSPNGDGLVSIHQNVKLYGSKIEPSAPTSFTPAEGAKLWIQIVKGKCEINGASLRAGDGAGLVNDNKLEIKADESSELLIFEILK